MAEAVSHRLLTAEAQARAKCVHVEFMLDNAAVGQVSYKFFSLPWQHDPTASP
jgi:hypothetical protein